LVVKISNSEECWIGETEMLDAIQEYASIVLEELEGDILDLDRIEMYRRDEVAGIALVGAG
jgi:hypothetical protein